MRGREISMCERYINRLPLTHSLLGTWPATQACALTGNRTCNLSVCRPALNPLSHTIQGEVLTLYMAQEIIQNPPPAYSLASSPDTPFFKKKNYFLERGEGREKRKTSMCMKNIN